MLRFQGSLLSVPASGEVTYYYWHDPRAKPVRVEMMTADIDSGVRVGKVLFIVLSGTHQENQLGCYELTPDNHQVSIYPDVVLAPGEGLCVFFSAVTAGDVVQCSAWGS